MLPFKYLSSFPVKIRHRFLTNASFLSGNSSQYIEDMYNAWLKDPNSVHVSWNSFFRSLSQNSANPYHPPPNFAPSANFSSGAPPAPPAPPQDKNIVDHLAVQGVIRSFQARGHLSSKLDPLEMWRPVTSGPLPMDVLKNYQLEMDKEYTLPKNTYIGGNKSSLLLKDIVQRLQEAYCGSIGVEYIYIDSLEERSFIRQHMETPGIRNLDKEMKLRTLMRLVRTTEFENFLAKKWTSEKRFGIEGCDMVVPGLKQIIDRSIELGVEHFFFGVAHRGRLNILANVFRKPLHQIFNQFVPIEPGDLGSGDVKYHYGSYTEQTNRVTQKKFKITLLANPSHLEAVNSSVLGRTRAEQVKQGDDKGKKSMAILLHGDASFCGQGVNYESLGLSYLPNYTTHGVICLIVNNQIGFTTDPRFSRSSQYCSDLGKVVNAPIFHVNGDDPEAVIHVCDLAAKYRAKFGKDFVIDFVGYRRHGHNEGDEPIFTQPLMYQKIHQMTPVVKKYQEKLIKEGIVTEQEIRDVETQYTKLCDDEFTKAGQQTQIYIRDWLDSPWEGFFEGQDKLQLKPTGVPESLLLQIANKFSSPPPDNLDFVIHKGLMRLLAARKKLTEERQADWAMGEAFAIGSLLKEGYPVRLSGEDVERGTFSHRHHVLHHQKIDKVTYEPLNNLFTDQAHYTVCNSSLSEYGVLGFEVGYCLAHPNTLVIWEGQFGDFFNGAQCVFDQFISAGESKWARQSGLVVLLPHGYEGMGSEHSSARVERFLIMCDDDPDGPLPSFDKDFTIKQLKDCNWIIANCSHPANLFHILRRQIYLPFRKPLIVFTPKSGLRLPACRSSFDDMLENTSFVRMIPEKGEASKNPKEVKKLLFCTGKCYYEILARRAKANLDKEIAVTRVEQLSPFPYDLVKEELAKYDSAKVFWAQEEPKNNGAYYYTKMRIERLLEGKRPLGYIGRLPSASPATGNKAQHIKEVEKLGQDFVAM